MKMVPNNFFDSFMHLYLIKYTCNFNLYNYLLTYCDILVRVIHVLLFEHLETTRIK